MPQQFSGPVTITGAGNQVLELNSTDPFASVTRLMAVTSNNRTESQLQFKSRLLLVAPLGEAGGKPIVTVGEEGNVGMARRFHRSRRRSRERTIRVQRWLSGGQTIINSRAWVWVLTVWRSILI